MILLVILAIFLIPIASIVMIQGTIVWYPQLLMLQFMGSLFFASRFWSLNKFLAIFLSYLAFSYVVVTSASPRTLLCLMIGYGAISITLAVSKIKNLKWIYIAMTVMAVLSILYSISQKLGFDPIFTPLDQTMKADVVSFMGSHNQLGIYSCANAFWAPWLIPFSIIPIFLTKCNSAMIGILAGSFVYVYYIFGKKWTVKLCILLLLLAAPWWFFCHKSNQELSERIKLWGLSVQQVNQGKIYSSDMAGHSAVIKANPWFGFGLGNFFSYSPFSQYKIYGLKKTEYYMNKFDVGKIEHFYEHAHNDLVEAFFEFGYVGIIILISFVISVLFVFWKSVKTKGVVFTFSSLIAQSFASMSVYVCHAPVSLFIFCLTLGLFYAEVNNANQSAFKPAS